MLFLKGMIIGIGKIIPGVSGSMLAISMGLYDKLIYVINNFFKNFKHNFKFIFTIGSGVLISIVFFSNLIVNCLEKYYIITMFLFIGLILGSFGEIKNNIQKTNNLVVFIIIVITVLLELISIKKQSNFLANYPIIYFFISGIIDAIATVVPGISGTAMLMMVGSYDEIITSFSNIISINLFCDLGIILPFILGLIIGVYFTTKLIGYLFKKHKNLTYSAIIGFSISSIIIMLIKSWNSTYSILELLVAILMLVIGYIITKKINRIISYD